MHNFPRCVRFWPFWAALGLIAFSAWKMADRWLADPDVLLATAGREFEAGRWGPAERLLNRVCGLRSPTAADRMLRARLALAHGRDAEALAMLGSVPDDDPRGSGARLRKGQLELRLGHLRAAEADLLRAVELNPQQALARRELIYIYGMQMRRQELAEQFRELLRLLPLTFDDLLVWGLARDKNWNPAEVEADLRRFVSADPQDRWSRLALIESLRQQGRLAAAEDQLAFLPANDPDARALYGSILLDRGDVARAELAVAGGSDDRASLACLRGQFALSHRDWAGATQHYRSALAIEPGRRAALCGLVVALHQAEAPESTRICSAALRACDVLNELLERAARDGGRDDPDVLDSLGSACEAAGRFSEAQAWYKLAVGEDPLNSWAQQALCRLAGRRQADTGLGSPQASANDKVHLPLVRKVQSGANGPAG
jgi:tetratricopeptide (TPR) repeat protein